MNATLRELHHSLKMSHIRGTRQLLWLTTFLEWPPAAWKNTSHDAETAETWDSRAQNESIDANPEVLQRRCW